MEYIISFTLNTQYARQFKNFFEDKNVDFVIFKFELAKNNETFLDVNAKINGFIAFIDLC